VLAESIELLDRICDQTLLTAIAEGTFGVTRRPPDGGKGADGVVPHAENYVNPATELLEEVS
jgi:beta-lysine 5,6-aminomutase alpha subunit